MKKMFCAAMTFIMVIMNMPILYARETSGDFEYDVTSDGSAIIMAYIGTDEDIVIPATIDGYSVTGIGRINNSTRIASGKNIKSVVISEGITYIGYEALIYSKSLTSVIIPSSVTIIAREAFYGCSNLTDLTIPNGVIEIGVEAFYECRSLKEITIPESVTSLAYLSFGLCTSLESVTIENGLTSIDRVAFGGCSSLTTVSLPDSITEIGFAAFNTCTSLTTITIPESVTNIDYSAFDRCTSLTNVIFNNPDTKFEEENGEKVGLDPREPTFMRCTNLSNMYAFRGSQAQSYALEQEIRFVPIANVVLNGEKLKFDVPAIIENDRVLVPMRGIFEALGAEVGWEGETSTVTAAKDNLSLSLQIGSTQMRLNSQEISLDVTPQIVLDRTVVPVRAVSESLNAIVDWDDETQTVTINTL